MHLRADLRELSETSAGYYEMTVCNAGILGTKYIRDEPIVEKIVIEQDDSITLRISKIYSAIPIGNILDIAVRQPEVSKLAFVTLVEYANSSEVQIDAMDIFTGDYELVL